MKSSKPLLLGTAGSMPAGTMMAVLASEVVVCIKCPLCKCRKKAVPGDGNIRAKVLFVGEAPGSSEDVAGRPFVGAAGKFLNELLGQIGLERKGVFITNIVKCRPPKNRKPNQLEIQTCTPYLIRQIRIIKPRLIVALGSTAASYLMPKAGLPFSKITQDHGQFHETSLNGQKVKLFTTFHPAAVLRGGQYREEIIADFRLLGRELTK